MAKRVGQVNEDIRQVEVRSVRRVKTTDIPWTAGPKTRRAKIARSLWG